MHTAEDVEEDPLFHELPLHTVFTWTRWWHLSAKALTLVLKKKVFAAVGPYLRREKDRIDNRIAVLRTDWSARGRELNRLDKIKRSCCLSSQLGCSSRYHRKTEKNMEHPTLGRRRRHKNPSVLQSAPPLPVPRLADHLDTDVVPSDEEGGKEAKRQKSEPTTPRSTCNRRPNEYDEIMGITQVDSREAERYEEGLEPEFQDAEEGSLQTLGSKSDSDHALCSSHGVMAVRHYKNV